MEEKQYPIVLTNKNILDLANAFKFLIDALEYKEHTDKIIAQTVKKIENIIIDQNYLR